MAHGVAKRCGGDNWDVEEIAARKNAPSRGDERIPCVQTVAQKECLGVVLHTLDM